MNLISEAGLLVIERMILEQKEKKLNTFQRRATLKLNAEPLDMLDVFLATCVSCTDRLLKQVFKCQLNSWNR